MKKRILRFAFILVLLVSVTAFSAHAFTIEQTHIIDNDDAQGYSNTTNAFADKISGSTLYYQDARIQECTETYSYYRYELSAGYARYTPIYGTVSAFLYNIRFTDPMATYSIGSGYSFMHKPVGTINQDLAAAGWNVIGTGVNDFANSSKLYITECAELEASGDHPGFYCGADAIKLELGY